MEPAVPRPSASSVDRILLAMEGAGALLRTYDVASLETKTKPDGSPFSQADCQAEAFLVQQLRDIAPDIQVVSEEDPASHAYQGLEEYFLLDALDGTREFLAGLDQYTVNVALVRNADVLFGAIYAPRREQMFWTTCDGRAMRRQGDAQGALQVRLPRPTGLVAVTSRSGPDNGLREFAGEPVESTVAVGSSLKFCLIASGHADVYVRSKPSHEWDIAAGTALVRAAGGTVNTLGGQPLRFGCRSNQHGGFVVRGLQT